MGIQLAHLKKLLISQVFLIIVCLGTALIVTILQAICFITVKPFNIYLYRCIGYYLHKTLHIHFVFLFQWWANCDLEIYSEPNTNPKAPTSENCILLGNHAFETDCPIYCTSAYTLGFLGMDKIVMKKELSMLPILGWYWKLSEHIFLDRNWKEDKTRLEKQLKRSFVKNPYPVSIPIYPEGTRYTVEKHQQSLKFAREKGLPEFKHLLLPRTKGFSVLNQHRDTKAGFTSILDGTFCCDPARAEPTIKNLMNGNSFSTKVFMKQHSINEVPLDEENSAKWLYSLFQDKDGNIAKYLQTGKVPRNFTKCLKSEKSLAALLNFICWAILILGPLVYWVLKSLFAGSFASVNIVIVIVTMGTYGLKSMMDAASVKKSS